MTGFLLWRRRRDLNPRTLSRLAVFETAPFSLLGTSPALNNYIIEIGYRFKEVKDM